MGSEDENQERGWKTLVNTDKCKVIWNTTDFLDDTEDCANPRLCKKWGIYLCQVLSDAKFHDDEMAYNLSGDCCIVLHFKSKATANGTIPKLKKLMEAEGFALKFDQQNHPIIHRQIVWPPPIDGVVDNDYDHYAVQSPLHTAGAGLALVGIGPMGPMWPFPNFVYTNDDDVGNAYSGLWKPN
jgi:hypothetical protein